MFDTAKLGLKLPEILLPNAETDMGRWSVIAVDQYTSQPEYWDEVKKYVGSSPSILNIVLPEIFLKNADVSQLIGQTKTNMKKYLDEGIFETLPAGVVLTERTMGGVLRKGILLAVDLERYDFRIENKPYVRATEKTVLERIPPRVAIRKGAPLESPHVLVLMDDINDSVIGPLHESKEKFRKIYDFDLMMGGGHICGYFSDDAPTVSRLASALENLPERDGMKFCVGDGNHSLATAKAVWDSVKGDIDAGQRENHPLRYAMCEFVNIHDDGIEFMPIHRVLFNVNAEKCLAALQKHLAACGIKTDIVDTVWTAGEKMITPSRIPFRSASASGYMEFDRDVTVEVAGCIQDALDSLTGSTDAEIDYIHGDEAFEKLTSEDRSLGLYMSDIEKKTFFDTVIDCGVLPRKTFSMGEAEQKRYYLECRKICSD